MYPSPLGKPNPPVVLANGKFLRGIMKKSGEKYISRAAESGGVRTSGHKFSQSTVESGEPRLMNVEPGQSDDVNYKPRAKVAKVVAFDIEDVRGVGDLLPLPYNKVPEIHKRSERKHRLFLTKNGRRV